MTSYQDRRALAQRYEKRSESPTSVAEGRFWSLLQAFSSGGIPGSAGISVNSENAMESTAWLAGTSRIAETFAALPCEVVQVKQEGDKVISRRAPEHYLWDIVHDAPNDWMTTFTWRETGMHHALSESKHYSQVVWAGDRVYRICPLLPTDLTPVMRPDGLIYQRTGTTAGELQPKEVLHIRALAWNGIDGRPRVQIAKEPIGTCLAQGRFAGTYYGNSAKPEFILKHPGELGDTALKRLAAEWDAKHRGVDNKHRPTILEEGMDIKELNGDPSKSQLLEARKYGVTETARALGIQPHMIADLTHATFSNIGQQSQEFLEYTLMPWTIRWEQEMNMKLFTPAERKAGYRIRFDFDGLLRADMATRFAGYAIGIQWGFYSVNDVRRLEGLNPIPGGDVYARPLNMGTIGPGGETNVPAAPDQAAAPAAA